MRVVFMGTPEFAVPALQALAEVHDVAAVYTRPDAPAGRGRAVRPSAVKVAAMELGIPVEQPGSLREPGAAARLGEERPEIVCVAAYGLILPPAVLAVPGHGCVNVHASLLPRWRGAAPIQRAILAGDELTGVSIMRMEEGLDTGPFALQRSVPVGERDAWTLTAVLARLGAAALLDAVASIIDGTVRWTPQDEAGATYAAKVTAADVSLSPDLRVADALRHVRASSPSAPCRMVLDGHPCVVLEAEACDASSLCTGMARTDRDLVLGLADGSVRVLRLVPAGKRPMPAGDYVRGARLARRVAWSPG